VKKPCAVLRITTPDLFTRGVVIDSFYFPYTTSIFAD
jgi:hypothetical protein